MQKFADKIYRATLNHRKSVLAIAVILCLICALLIPAVKINYQFSDYLPESSPSTVALRVMDESFDSTAPNTHFYAQGLSLAQAAQLAEDIKTVPGVESVMWLGDVVDVAKPLELYDQDIVSSYKVDDGYLFQVAIQSAKGQAAIDGVRAAAENLGATGTAFSGEAVNTAIAQSSSGVEIQIIMIMAVLVILGLLLLTSRSWFDPVLFLLVIGMSIVYNLGSNIIFGEISFITQMCAAILQLAVSMDYGIVMLNAYKRFKAQDYTSYEAAIAAMHKAASVIASSAATTFFGFLSLCVMAFLIGADMGLVLAKGIVFSFLSVLFILPILILTFERVLTRTEHRNLLPSFDKFAHVCLRIAVPFTIVIALITVPAYLAQRQPNYVYGASGFVTPGTQLYEDAETISNAFGSEEQWVLLVPEGHWGDEKALIAQLEALPEVNTVVSYATAVSEKIPTQMVPSDSLKSLISNGYSRLIIYTSVVGESDESFALIQQVRDIAGQCYGTDCHLVGSAVTAYDMSLIVNDDSFRVFMASIIAIGLVLLLMFRSVSIPIMLLLSIEISIWINLAIPYFFGTEIQYIGYLIISAIMLGATVDYTIILSRSYLENRKEMLKRPAMVKAISDSAVTILTSATILTVCGILIGVISTNGVISGLGTLIGRGAFIAALNTFLLLPMLFLIFDKVVEKTTLNAHFYNGDGSSGKRGPTLRKGYRVSSKNETKQTTDVVATSVGIEG